MPPTPDTRASLIVRLSDLGDERAWQEFVEIYQPLILRMTLRRGLQEADAVEVTQEILMRVAQAVDRFTPTGREGSFRAWLFRIARNLSINHLSRNQGPVAGSGDSQVREQIENHPSPDRSLSAEFELEYRRRIFHWAAERVRDDVQNETWQAFWQTAVEARPTEDVAAELGVSRGTIYVARCRVIHRLRLEIERLESEE